MIANLLPTYNRADLKFVSGQGAWLQEESGRQYLDLSSGIAVNALGHAHPALVTALTEQANALWHTSNMYRIPKQEELAAKLVAATFADRVFFTNSGTEACELAIKMVRKLNYDRGNPDRIGIIAFSGSFHGRSSAAIAAAGAEKLAHGFGPLLPGFVQVPFGDLDAVRAMIDENTAAIILEPIQGEGGIHPFPDEALREIRALCDAHDLFLILDEVQCGMGRTGRLFAHEWAGITPDIMMIAKGIGGGFPLGAVVATEDAAAGMTAGTHGSTYGGNPLACAVGCAVMDIIDDPGFLEQVRAVAGYLRQRLEGLVASHPLVFEEVRGTGLMLGLKCRVPAGDVIAAGYEAGVLGVPAADNVVRILPPLTISEADIAEAIVRLDAAAHALSSNLNDPA